MILVDTSALIPYLRGQHTTAAALLDELLSEDHDVYLAPPVIQEVLQGARDEAEWRRLREYLSSQLLADVRDARASAVAAARIYFDCRRRGYTLRSSVDCLVAQIALENRFALLHDDRDFEAIRRVRPLRTLP